MGVTTSCISESAVVSGKGESFKPDHHLDDALGDLGTGKARERQKHSLLSRFGRKIGRRWRHHDNGSIVNEAATELATEPATSPTFTTTDEAASRYENWYRTFSPAKPRQAQYSPYDESLQTHSSEMDAEILVNETEYVAELDDARAGCTVKCKPESVSETVFVPSEKDLLLLQGWEVFVELEGVGVIRGTQLDDEKDLLLSVEVSL
jgi:hypothetical protein